MNGVLLTLLFPLVIIILVIIVGGLRVIDQYERGVVLFLGKYYATYNPGLNWIFPGLMVMYKVDLRITTVDIPQQEVITRDNVPVGINAVVYFQVENAENAILKIKDYTYAIAQYAQATLRDVIGGVELDTLLTERDKISGDIKKVVDIATAPWGINVTDIKIQDIELPADMKRVMAKQAEAERERRAVIIRASGELTASENLKAAAKNLSSEPGGLSLRTLKTIESINPDPSKTVIFALPIEFMEGVKSLTEFFRKK